jgi:hypothetical protein
MIALVANTPPPAIIECRGRARVSSVQHRVWVALGRSCSGDRALPVKAGKLGLGVLTGQRGSAQFLQRGAELSHPRCVAA